MLEYNSLKSRPRVRQLSASLVLDVGSDRIFTASATEATTSCSEDENQFPAKCGHRLEIPSYTERCTSMQPVATHLVGLTTSCGPRRQAIASVFVAHASAYIGLPDELLP